MNITTSHVTATEYELDGGTVVTDFLDRLFLATYVTVSTAASGSTSVTVLGVSMNEDGKPELGKGIFQIFMNRDQESALIHWIADKIDEQAKEEEEYCISNVERWEGSGHPYICSCSVCAML